jgi:ABC-2 type transport system permease protein
MGVSMLILFPLTFGSNIFVNPATMPGWLQAFVQVNPITHVVTGVRNLMHGTATAEQVIIVLLISAGLVAVMGPLTMYIYRTKNNG